jgi:hypothetical protein
MLQYPARLIRDTNNTILAEFPDVPEAYTFGEDEDDPLINPRCPRNCSKPTSTTAAISHVLRRGSAG